MIYYVARRVLYAIPIMFGVSLIVFIIIHLAPGDPLAAVMPDLDQSQIAQMRAAFGYDKPLPIQYFDWLANAVQGNLGVSLKTGSPVLSVVLPAVWHTVAIGVGAFLVCFVLGGVTGMIAGYHHNTTTDKIVSAGAIGGISVPNYWLAMLLMIVFAVELDWLPATGAGASGLTMKWDSIRFMILPILALAAIPTGVVARTTRACVMEVVNEDFVQALRAKGLSEFKILLHVAKNVLPTVLAVAGLQFAHLMGGSILVETVFNWPGTGYLLNIAIFSRDIPLLQGVLLILSMFFVFTNLIVDVLQTLIDPRIRRG